MERQDDPVPGDSPTIPQLGPCAPIPRRIHGPHPDITKSFAPFILSGPDIFWCPDIDVRILYVAQEVRLVVYRSDQTLGVYRGEEDGSHVDLGKREAWRMLEYSSRHPAVRGVWTRRRHGFRLTCPCTCTPRAVRRPCLLRRTCTRSPAGADPIRARATPSARSGDGSRLVRRMLPSKRSSRPVPLVVSAFRLLPTMR